MATEYIYKCSNPHTDRMAKVYKDTDRQQFIVKKFEAGKNIEIAYNPKDSLEEEASFISAEIAALLYVNNRQVRG